MKQDWLARYYRCRIWGRNHKSAYPTKEEIRAFCESPHICEYCEIPEEEWMKKYKRKLELDRKDNALGYSIDNIVWACHRCNQIKNNFLSYEEMKEIGKKYIKPKWRSLSYKEET